MKDRFNKETCEELVFEAAAKGQTETVAFLLDKGGIDPKAKDSFALRLAAASGFATTVSLLVQRGADIRARNDQALRMAAVNGHAEVVAILTQGMSQRHAADQKARVQSYRCRWCPGPA